MHVSFRTVGLAVTEHIEPFGVPIVDCVLNQLLRLSAFSGEFGGRVGAKVDVSFFFADDVRIFDHAGQWQIGAINKFLELETTDAVDQKTKNGKILPRLDLAAKRFNVPFLVGPAKRVGDIDADVAGEP